MRKLKSEIIVGRSVLLHRGFLWKSVFPFFNLNNMLIKNLGILLIIHALKEDLNLLTDWVKSISWKLLDSKKLNLHKKHLMKQQESVNMN